MRSNYKRLGDYVDVVNKRNKKLEVETLLGVSIRKVLMPSIANTIGTNMTTYKIIKRNQFAYGPVTSRNGEKISIAILDEYDEAIVSQAYTVFKIKDEKALNPEYLMMWFRRPEFDRYARYKSHGSAREIFDWNEMLETELPIPSIEKQQEIVKEYNVVKNRIVLNEQLNQNLEETAQALYKHWFVDFEFPVSKESHPKLVSGSQPLGYNSAGGKMVFNEELDKEIPEGWEVDKLGNITAISAGGDKPKTYSIYPTDFCNIPIYSNSSNNDGLFGFTNKAKVSVDSITISARGAILGFTRLRLHPFFPIVRLIVITPKNEYSLSYLFFCVDNFEFDNTASAQGQLTVPEISFFKIMIPSDEILKMFHKTFKKILTDINLTEVENKKLRQLTDIILSKMARVENKLILSYE